MIGSAIPCETPGWLLVAIDDGLMLLDFATGALELLAAPQPNTGEFRYNDTRPDAAGRIFTSTVSKFLTEPYFDPETMTGKFYMVDLDGTVVTLVDRLVQYNSVLFDSRNENMYVIDTHNKKPQQALHLGRGRAVAVAELLAQGRNLALRADLAHALVDREALVRLRDVGGRDGISTRRWSAARGASPVGSPRSSRIACSRSFT